MLLASISLILECHGCTTLRQCYWVLTTVIVQLQVCNSSKSLVFSCKLLLRLNWECSKICFERPCFGQINWFSRQWLCFFEDEWVVKKGVVYCLFDVSYSKFFHVDWGTVVHSFVWKLMADFLNTYAWTCAGEDRANCIQHRTWTTSEVCWTCASSYTR